MLNSKYQVVTNHTIMSQIKRSPYFTTNLGYSVTTERNGERVLNENDHFAGSYNYQYKTSIYAQGNIGDIFFYVDYGILDPTIAAYYNLEEFIFDFDDKFVSEKGISAYLGHILKKIDMDYQQRIKTKEEEKEITANKGQAEKIFSNPGAVTYDDIKAYIQQKKI